MKNIFLVPTDEPTQLYSYNDRPDFFFTDLERERDSTWVARGFNMLITSNEKIEKGDWFLAGSNRILRCYLAKNNTIYYVSNSGTLNIEPVWCKKIILATDLKLIKEGIQEIDDQFLEWFVNNPTCEEVKITLVKDSEAHPEIEGGYTEEWEFYEIEIPEKNIDRLPFPKLVEELAKYYNSPIVEEPTMVDKLKEYFKNTSKEQFQKDWDKARKETEETLEEAAKFIVFTYQDSEDWTQHSIPLDSFEKADEFAQQFRSKKISYLICKIVKQGYNGN